MKFNKTLKKIILSIIALIFAFTLFILSLTCIIIGQKNVGMYTNSYKEVSEIILKDCAYNIAQDCAKIIENKTYPVAVNQIKDDFNCSNVGISFNRYNIETTENFNYNVFYSDTFYYVYNSDQHTNYNLTMVPKEEYNSHPHRAYTVYISISFPDTMMYDDIYADIISLYEFLFMLKYIFIILAVISLVCIIGIILCMIKLNQHNSEVSNKFEQFCDTPLSTIIYAGTLIVTAPLALLYIHEINKLLLYTYDRLYFRYYVAIILTLIIASISVSIFIYEFIRRLLERTFFNRLISVKIYHSLNILGKGFMLGLLAVIFLIVAFILSINLHPIIMPVAIILIMVLWVIFVHYLSKLSVVVDNYAKGDWDDCLAGCPLIVSDVYNNMNKIRTSMQATVAKSIRDERTKTELITNVSHDIKTPLTSIINYTDLLKNENITEEERRQYLETLSRNSARMKKLIEDLIEASKASTGNIILNMMNCNLSTLISQSIAEHSNNATVNNLKIVCSNIDTDIFIHVDGSKLYRVFDNILNNACKYSLKGSRIYISAVVDEQVNIIFKNISEQEITISPDELTERFVRGDISRHSEGSGLGLAIAKSLTELMKGRLAIDIDGDQFKVTLSFPKIIS